MHLAERLEREKYLVIYFAADDDIDMSNLVYTDLLLSIIKRRLERTLSLKGITIDERLSRGIMMWFAEVIYGWKDEAKIEAELKTEFEL